MWLGLCSLWLLLPSASALSLGKTEVVRTKYGLLQGLVHRVGRDALQRRHVELYLGIPYASAPIGNLRFSPARPPPYWSGILQTHSFGPSCPQSVERREKIKVEKEDEDCLYMNIYVPKVEKSELRPNLSLPVLVLIHGPSFSSGSASTLDGRVLAAQGRMIVVTFNFRLGILGFLNWNSRPNENPRVANFGLLDQIAALKWLQESIGGFGGNRDAVTVMGIGTGAKAAHLLLKSPILVQGLFGRAVLLAGASDSFPVNNNVDSALKLARKLGCLEQNQQRHDDLLPCLRSRSVQQLLNVSVETPTFLEQIGPSVDGVVVLNEKGDIKKGYQVMLGLTTMEGKRYLSDSELLKGLSAESARGYLRTLVQNTYEFHLNEIFAAVATEYEFNEDKWSWPNKSLLANKNSLVEAITDKFFLAPLVNAARELVDNHNRVYFFVMDEHGDHVDHGDDVDYVDLMLGLPLAPELWDNHKNNNEDKNNGDHDYDDYNDNTNEISKDEGNYEYKRDKLAKLAPLAQKLVSYLSNFVHNGDPTKSFYDRNERYGRIVSRVTWPEYSLARPLPHLRIHRDSMDKAGSEYRRHALSLWLSLVPQLHDSSDDSEWPSRHHAFESNANFEGIVRSVSYLRTGSQVNRKFVVATTISSTMTTCSPVVGEHLWHSEITPYLIVASIAVLVLANVWFLTCLFVCRARLAQWLALSRSNDVEEDEIRQDCSRNNVAKDNSCHTELAIIASSPQHTLRRESLSRTSPSMSSVMGYSTLSQPRERQHLATGKHPSQYCKEALVGQRRSVLSASQSSLLSELRAQQQALEQRPSVLFRDGPRTLTPQESNAPMVSFGGETIIHS